MASSTMHMGSYTTNPNIVNGEIVVTFSSKDPLGNVRSCGLGVSIRTARTIANLTEHCM